jgi:hypothetical protein
MIHPEMTQDKLDAMDRLASMFFEGSGDILAASSAIRAAIQRRLELIAKRAEAQRMQANDGPQRAKRVFRREW